MTISKLTLNILEIISKSIRQQNTIANSSLDIVKNMDVDTENNVVNIDLITEKDIIKVFRNYRVLCLKKGTIITPLAKDKARELGINIEIK